MAYLSGKRVLITGASSGIGAQLGRECAARGAAVGLLARRADRLEALAREIEQAGGKAAWAEADVTDRAALRAALDRLAEALGGADVVVANAGWGKPVPAHKDRESDARAIYAVNLDGALNTLYWAVPRFVEAGGGHLVGVASLASYLGLPLSSAYSGSKAALRVHLQALRVELRPRGIYVTTVCPGFIRTPLTEHNKFPMPFLWDVERAARRIAGAIEARKGEVAFPWQLVLPLWLGRAMPSGLTERVLRGFRAN